MPIPYSINDAHDLEYIASETSLVEVFNPGCLHPRGCRKRSAGVRRGLM